MIRPPPLVDLTDYHWFDTCPGCPACDLPIPYGMSSAKAPLSSASLAGATTEKQGTSRKASASPDSVAGAGCPGYE